MKNSIENKEFVKQNSFHWIWWKLYFVTSIYDMIHLKPVILFMIISAMLSTWDMSFYCHYFK